MNLGKQLKEGLLTQNPVLVQMLGLCSAFLTMDTPVTVPSPSTPTIISILP